MTLLDVVVIYFNDEKAKKKGSPNLSFFYFETKTETENVEFFTKSKITESQRRTKNVN